MNQTTLWLVPLIASALLGILNVARSGIRWSWGTQIQFFLVLIIGILGFLIPKYDWLFALLGWLCLLSFTLVAGMLLKQMTYSLGLLRTKPALKSAALLRFLLWGPPGAFWVDLIKMVDSYANRNPELAEEIYQKWRIQKLPKALADSLDAYAMLGLVLTRDWNGVVSRYENAKRRYEEQVNAELAGLQGQMPDLAADAGVRNGEPEPAQALANSRQKKAAKGAAKAARFPAQIAVSAIRAFAELGLISRSVEALQLADFPTSGYSRESLDTIFLSYFALLGKREDLDRIIEGMKGRKMALPEFARLYWKARCEAVLGNLQGALSLYEESLAKTPSSDTSWRERTERQCTLIKERLSRQEAVFSEAQTDKSELESEKENAARIARQILSKCTVVSDIMSGSKKAPAVNALVLVICAVFGATYLPRFSSDSSMSELYVNTYIYGMLRGDNVFHGEAWRLLSYLFLHGGLSHLIMNVLCLVWFGRYVENIYGSRRFLLIFFGAGVLSGVAHMVLTPEIPAVGASGAIFGVFGAGAAATIRLKDVLPASIRKSELTSMALMAITQILFDQLVNWLFQSSGDGDAVRIAAYAHIGGMISGFILGWILPMRKFVANDIHDVK